MNIIITGTAYPLRGGIAHFNALLASHLGKRHHVETITFKRQYPRLLFPGKTQAEIGCPPETQPAPQLIDSLNPFNWIQVARKIRRKNPDLLIFKYWMPYFGPCFGTIARLSKKWSSTKVLFICDNIVPHERRLGDLFLTRYAFKPVDYFIVQSSTVERDLLEYFPGSVYKKVPHPTYENFGSPISKEQSRTMLGISAHKVLLYFGYVRAYKGLHVLIDAMKKIIDEGLIRDVVLLVVGEFYDDEDKYRTRIWELSLQSTIRFVSQYVPNSEVANYFSAADVVVLPYLSATQSGIVQIAYNFDKPVIATDVGGLAEVIIDEKTGFIVRPNNPEELAMAIRKFYNEGKEAEFSANVKNEKQKYSWEHFVTTIEQLALQ